MKNFVQPGNCITVTAAAEASAGDVVKIGNMIGIAAGDAAEGDSLDIELVGVFELPKTEALEISVGDKVYWDAANSVVNKTASGNTLLGIAVAAAANPSATARVRLNGSF